MKNSRQNFAGLRIVAFESRRAAEMQHLIEHYKGVATVVPSIREVPLETNEEELQFERALLAGEVDITILLTGVGVRLLANEIETRVPRAVWTEALKKTALVARGPKPIAALRDLGVPVALRIAEPNTWREILAAFDERRDTLPLKGRLVAVQEYGMMNRNLLKGLKSRGATVLRIPVYRWALPEDTGHLRQSIEKIIDGEFDVALFTAGTQVWHLFKLASKKGLEEELRTGLLGTVIGSVGPATSEALAEFDLLPDLVPNQPRMGLLVQCAAQRAIAALQTKRPTVSR